MKFLKSIPYKDLLFIDIETVPIVPKLYMDTPLWESWNYKYRHNRDNTKFEGTVEESFLQDAALYSEFSKIVTICIGIIREDKALRIKSFTNDNEAILLKEFCETLDNITAGNKNIRLVGHAIVGFDIPFIMRRCVVNQIELPTLIDTGHLKPWELTAIDTLTLWKGTGFNASSLINICVALGINSPKDEMEGEQTYEYYYNISGGLKLIEKYCVKDVVSVANVVRKLRYETLLEIDNEVKPLEEKVGVLEQINNTKKVSVKHKQHIDKVMVSLDEESKKIATELLTLVTN